MAIVNRDLDASQQRVEYQVSINPAVTGATYVLAVMPYPAQLIAVNQSAVGLSGAPNTSLWLNRFVVGAGITTISFGNSFVVTALGTSGAQGYSLPLASTFLLQAGDSILMSTAAANTSVASLNVTLVIKALQDVKTHFGV